ncbi:hypothetical protein IU500_17495 [Nocardia terpenica]|uniref:N-terminal phage integrase SAM-like domain-containing protein n=1 Tax=Nocardia terpenica TaxID=455432 RepID=UPI00189508E1|nr:N-terminal phage integrase SAM-like domain-containing protein [Nocardia terpenica]MBF6063280.1 hypothetical protein [Nocardia terpenica]MBF6105836.1 hypothetical protein [Nocardia terpenica]MBF6113580.1 hypothetical protein [Nocardia terpenica]MBF6119577.1 hypothetical protein [Nocardia terpenica]MBF6151988.1 hypothetical protein [Nocardia terpenica]
MVRGKSRHVRRFAGSGSSGRSRPQPEPGGIVFADYADRWYRRQDLAENTMSNYKSYLECHLLPRFGEISLNRIGLDEIARWERVELAVGNERSSIAQWKGLLHTIFEDARDEGLITSNPAAKKRGRGRRGSRRPGRRPTGVVLTGLHALLIAERMALLSGRDDEFVWEITKRYTGMRSGELHGLETRYLSNTRHPRRRLLRVE